MTFGTTRRPRPTRHAAQIRRARFTVLTFSLALAGCGTPPAPTAGPAPSSAVGTNDPAWVTLRPKLPPPDADRINYDEHTRTLTLYDLPGNDRWMVQMPDDDAGRPARAQQRIPADAALSRVAVYYVRPGMKPSAPVSVQQIRDIGHAHNSLAVLR